MNMGRMKETVMKRQGSPEKRAEMIEKQLEKISVELQPLLQDWLDNGEVSDDTNYEGYSLNSLMADYDMMFTGAILTLDWLIRDPETAKKALKEGVR